MARERAPPAKALLSSQRLATKDVVATKHPAQDCLFEEWSDWTSCTAACGEGQHSRGRTIKAPSKYGGKQCSGPEEEIKQCESAPCPEARAIDCAMGEWEDWGACTKCAGQRMRVRNIMTYPLHGGKPCDADMLETTEPCPRSCEDNSDKFCTWNAWTEWTQCSSSCGAGQRSRRKYLGLADTPEPPVQDLVDSKQLIARYEALSQKVLQIEQTHSQDMLVAFAAGCGCILMGFFSLRVFATTRRAVAREDAYLSAVDAEANSQDAPIE